MSLYSILVTNNAPGCNSEIEQQLTVAGCVSYIVKIPPNSNAVGPFSVYVNDVIYYSNVTRNDMINGVVVDLDCVTPTPTSPPIPTPTPTSPPIPTPTPPTPTPSPYVFSAYIFPEPQDSTSQNDLGQYMFDNGSNNYYGYSNSGGPAGGPSYSNDLTIYVQYPGWEGSSGNFITNVSTLSGAIRQISGSGTDSYGCTQNQYTFGSIPITTSQVDVNTQYVYTVWVPLAGVGNTMNNMTLDVGTGGACSTTIIDNGIPDLTNAGIDVIVPSGCAIPSGTYRVLWMPELYLQPITPPKNNTMWIKGDTKS